MIGCLAALLAAPLRGISGMRKGGWATPSKDVVDRRSGHDLLAAFLICKVSRVGVCDTEDPLLALIDGNHLFRLVIVVARVELRCSSAIGPAILIKQLKRLLGKVGLLKPAFHILVLVVGFLVIRRQADLHRRLLVHHPIAC